MIKIKGAHQLVEKDDGFRILMDGLWSWGVSKEKAKLDLWLKDIAPSDDLRKWFAMIRKDGKSSRRGTGKNFAIKRISSMRSIGLEKTKAV